MFKNVIDSIGIAICIPEQTKEMHYKAMLSLGIIPLVHIPKNKMDLTDPMCIDIINQFPELTGVIIPISYNPY